MRSPLRLAVAVCTALTLAVHASAQAHVLKVGGAGPFTTLQAAVSAAVDGDVILVSPGTYSGCTVQGKGLTIVRDGSGVVTVKGIRVLGPSTAHAVVLSDIEIRPDVGSALEVMQYDGPVRVQGCDLIGSNGSVVPFHEAGFGAYVRLSYGVAFFACSLRGGRGADCLDTSSAGYGGPGVYMYTSNISFYGCSVQAGDGGDCFDTKPSHSGGEGGVGVYQVIGQTFFSGTTVRGGDGGDAWEAPFSRPVCGGNAGHGMHIGEALPLAVAVARVLATTFAPGQPGVGLLPPFCVGESGVPIFHQSGLGTVVQLSGMARSLAIDRPLREGELGTWTFTGVPGEEVWLFAGDVARRFLFVPLWTGTWLVRAGQMRVIGPLGPIPAGGTLQISMPVPELGAGIDARVRHLQALFVDPSGAAYLATAQVEISLDSAQ